MPSEETQIRNGEATSPRVFDTFRSSGSSRKTSPHEIGFETFGKVFANDLAKIAIEKNNLNFPQGSIFVREKFMKESDFLPETVTAMVKREKGFSRKTNDWGFFTFNGGDLKLQKRETKSDCSKCHAQAKDTDFVFKTYLK
jgi:Cytochrome P460